MTTAIMSRLTACVLAMGLAPPGRPWQKHRLWLPSVVVEGCTLLLGVYKLCTIRPAPMKGARERGNEALVGQRSAVYHPEDSSRGTIR
jgi:hypothetical protein